MLDMLRAVGGNFTAAILARAPIAGKAVPDRARATSSCTCASSWGMRVSAAILWARDPATGSALTGRRIHRGILPAP